MEPNEDIEHLRLLSIFHYVVASATALFSLFPLIHVAIGIAIVTGIFNKEFNGDPPPALFGWMFICFPLFMIIIGLSFSAAIAMAGRRLKQRTSYLYCLIIAGIECCFMPFGTVLGVFTILVLIRPSTKLLFDTPTDPTTPNQT